MDKKQYKPEEILISVFNKLLHIVRIHNDTNELVNNAVVHFINSVKLFADTADSVTIEVARGRFYIQGQKLLHRNETVTTIHHLMVFFESIGVTGFSLSTLLDKNNIDEIVFFIRALNQSVKETIPVDSIAEAIEKKDLNWVKIIYTKEEKKEFDVDQIKERAKKVYSYTYNSVFDVTQKVAAGKRAGIRQSIRIVQDMADMIIDEDPFLLGMSTIKDYDNYTYNHSVNVAILAMYLGDTIGLSKKSLVRLGICGLFHDLGKVDIDLRIINKPGKLTDSELITVQEHSLNSVRHIIKLQTFRKFKAQIILPPFEHHLKYDLSGYPKVNWSNPISLFGRIITICDVYDALSSARSYRPFGISPDKALGMMLKCSGYDFDPILLKWFINMVGVFPVGTLLEFSDGLIGLVVKSNAEVNPTKPRVVLLIPDNIGGYIKGREVELSEQDPATGQYLRTIVQSCNPSQKGIRTVDFLL